MEIALRRDGEPDMADDAGSVRQKELLHSSGGNAPGIAIAAGAVEAGLLQRFIVLRAGVSGQEGRSRCGRTAHLWQGGLGCGSQAAGGQYAAEKTPPSA